MTSRLAVQVARHRELELASAAAGARQAPAHQARAGRLFAPLSLMRRRAPAATHVPPLEDEDARLAAGRSARKVMITLATGLEDVERVTVAFLIGGAALARGDAALTV